MTAYATALASPPITSTQTEHKIFELALLLADGIGPITAKQLVSYCGSASAVFRANKKELYKIPKVGPSTYDAIHAKGLLRKAEKERWKY